MSKNVYNSKGDKVIGSYNTGEESEKLGLFKLDRLEITIEYMDDLNIKTIDQLMKDLNKRKAGSIYPKIKIQSLEPIKYCRTMTKKEYDNSNYKKLSYERWAKDCLNY